MSDTHRVYRQHTKVFIIFDPFCLIKLENVDVVVSVTVTVTVVAAAAAITLSVLFYLLVVGHICTLIRTHRARFPIYAFPFG